MAVSVMAPGNRSCAGDLRGDPQKNYPDLNHQQINGYCFKSLIFGVVYYLLMDNLTTITILAHEIMVFLYNLSILIKLESYGL